MDLVRIARKILPSPDWGGSRAQRSESSSPQRYPELSREYARLKVGH